MAKISTSAPVVSKRKHDDYLGTASSDDELLSDATNRKVKTTPSPHRRVKPKTEINYIPLTFREIQDFEIQTNNKNVLQLVLNKNIFKSPRCLSLADQCFDNIQYLCIDIKKGLFDALDVKYFFKIILSNSLRVLVLKSNLNVKFLLYSNLILDNLVSIKLDTLTDLRIIRSKHSNGEFLPNLTNITFESSEFSAITNFKNLAAFLKKIHYLRGDDDDLKETTHLIFQGKYTPIIQEYKIFKHKDTGAMSSSADPNKDPNWEYYASYDFPTETIESPPALDFGLFRDYYTVRYNCVIKPVGSWPLYESKYFKMGTLITALPENCKKLCLILDNTADDASEFNIFFDKKINLYSLIEDLKIYVQLKEDSKRNQGYKLQFIVDVLSFDYEFIDKFCKSLNHDKSIFKSCTLDSWSKFMWRVQLSIKDDHNQELKKQISWDD